MPEVSPSARVGRCCGDSSSMNAARVLARMVIVALAALLIGGCHWRTPRPGKPTATVPDRPALLISKAERSQ